VDRAISAARAREMVQALQETNPHVESMGFPNSSHADWPVADRIVMLTEREAFLRPYLPPMEPATKP